MKKHYSWQINPTTGDFLLDAFGLPMRDETLKVPAYIRLKTSRKQWMYAPDNDYGSDFYIARKKTTQTSTALENIGNKALQPLIDDNRASSAEFTLNGMTRHGESFLCDIVDVDKQTETFVINPVR